MPSMQSPATQCCLCVVGVFIFLAGLISTSTGICLVLNYGVFDITLLPPEMQSEEGKRTVGIILTSCGLFGMVVSVFVSILFLCTRPKLKSRTANSVKPDDIAALPNGDLNSDRTPVPKDTATTVKPTVVPVTAQTAANREGRLHSRPMPRKQHRHKKHFKPAKRLEGIKEVSLSRKSSAHFSLKELDKSDSDNTSRKSDGDGEMTESTFINDDSLGATALPEQKTHYEMGKGANSSSSNSSETGSSTFGSHDSKDTDSPLTTHKDFSHEASEVTPFAGADFAQFHVDNENRQKSSDGSFTNRAFEPHDDQERLDAQMADLIS